MNEDETVTVNSGQGKRARLRRGSIRGNRQSSACGGRWRADRQSPERRRCRASTTCNDIAGIDRAGRRERYAPPPPPSFEETAAIRCHQSYGRPLRLQSEFQEKSCNRRLLVESVSNATSAAATVSCCSRSDGSRRGDAWSAIGPSPVYARETWSHSFGKGGIFDRAPRPS